MFECLVGTIGCLVGVFECLVGQVRSVVGGLGRKACVVSIIVDAPRRPPWRVAGRFVLPSLCSPGS